MYKMTLALSSDGRQAYRQSIQPVTGVTWGHLHVRVGVCNMAVSVYQGLLGNFPVGVAIIICSCTQAFQHDMPRFRSSGLFHVSK